MNMIDFTISDLIAGYVTRFYSEKDAFGLETFDGREFLVDLSSTAYGEIIRNLGEGYRDPGRSLKEMLVPGRYLFVYGIFYPEGLDGGCKFEAKHIVFPGLEKDEYRFEEQDWWINQISQLADFYIKAEFGDGEIDYRKYRTNLTLTGEKEGDRQETDTISRFIYGFATAFLMTGEDRYLEVANKGTEYLREKLKLNVDDNTCLWYHALDIKDNGTEERIFASQSDDDRGAIACYEQIYALAGPIQTYRATGDPRIMEDAKATINMFNRYFLDTSPKGGFFSHIDPETLSPHSESLGKNLARKNWNSVGDHAPAYLVNLWLATGKKEYADFLEYTFDTIIKHFPDYEDSPFVQEKFYEDWSHDTTWFWQQNRAIMGHNLKIAWNLTRMHSLKQKPDYIDLAKKIATIMPLAGYDRQRSGWYDAMERILCSREKFHRFVWHDRKVWWQQEQAILAYLILNGTLKTPKYLQLARESSAFYNAWFLDSERGGVYFHVLANGHPYVWGGERGKGSHSMACYHAFELAYLAAVYTNLLIKRQPMDLYFKPMQSGFEDNILRVAPDILPPGSVRIERVWINGQEYANFDGAALIVKLPDDLREMKVKVRLIAA